MRVIELLLKQIRRQVPLCERIIDQVAQCISICIDNAVEDDALAFDARNFAEQLLAFIGSMEMLNDALLEKPVGLLRFFV